jgi:hypothetical protein
MSDSLVDSLASATCLNLGGAASVSMGLVSIAQAHALGLQMMNAMQAQRNAQITANAALSQCCALMISAGAAKAAND